MVRRWSRLLVIVVVLIGSAGCAGGSDEPRGPTPLVSVTTSSTAPEKSPTATPVTEQEALYAEAERVLRRSVELEAQIIKDGADQYPAELTELLADRYLVESQALFLHYREVGWKFAADSYPTVTLRRQPTMSVPGSEAALEGCMVTMPAYDEGGRLVSDSVQWHMFYFFRHIDGKLKLFADQGMQEVSQCPFG